MNADASAATAPAAISLRGVSKSFRRHGSKGDYSTLKSTILGRIRGARERAAARLSVLRDLDLEISRGTTLGIIGRNGSGKSTLLKLMAGIIRPDKGTVELVGSASPLIELGAGFHPEFSGRENVHLNGLVLGLSPREIDERFDEIVAFSELEAFIDAPVRTYSSGMYMRLAFSVAVHANPDVLLIDEILTVGDEGFVVKCQERMAAFQDAGKTIVMVSHDLGTIERWCHEAIWIDGGGIAARGFPSTVVRRYHEAVEMEKASEIPPPPAGSLRDSRSPGELRALLRVVEPPGLLPERWHMAIRTLVEAKNIGDTVWRSLPPTRRGMVMLGGRLYAGERFLGEIDRALLPRDVYPGEKVSVELRFGLPEAGRYRLDLDLIADEICWFGDRGSRPFALEVEA